MPPFKAELNTMFDGSTLEVDYDKNLTRLYEAIGMSDWDLAVRAASDSPDEARTWVVRYPNDVDYEEGEERPIEWRFLPIHSACARNPPKAVIASLLRAYPDGAKCVDDQGMYPLHYACGNQASREVIRNLLVSYPQAAGIADPNGQYPIHYIAQFGPSESGIVDMLLVANRAVCNAEDNDGYTPIEYTHDVDYALADEVIAALQRYAPPAPTAAEVPPSPSTAEVITSNVAVEEKDVVIPTVKRTNMSAAYSPPYSSRSPTPSLPPVQQESKPEEPVATVSRALEESPPNYHEEKKESTPPRSSPPASTSTEVSSSMSDKTVARLRAEVNKLKAERDFANAQLAEVIEEEKYKSVQTVEELRSKLNEANSELLQLRDNQSGLTDRVSTLEKSLQEKDAEIERIEEEKMKAILDAEEEKAQLRKEISELTEKTDTVSMKSKQMGSRLDAISHSLETIASGHERIMEANVRQEELIRSAQAERQKKLRELLSLEEAFEQDSVAAMSVDGVVLNKAYEKQKREMSAIQAILDAARE